MEQQPILSLELDDGADTFSLVHQFESFIDSFQRQGVGHHRVDFDLAAHVAIHIAGQLRTALTPPNAVPRQTLPVTS